VLFERTVISAKGLHVHKFFARTPIEEFRKRRGDGRVPIGVTFFAGFPFRILASLFVVHCFSGVISSSRNRFRSRSISNATLSRDFDKLYDISAVVSTSNFAKRITPRYSGDSASSFLSRACRLSCCANTRLGVIKSIGSAPLGLLSDLNDNISCARRFCRFS